MEVTFGIEYIPKEMNYIYHSQYKQERRGCHGSWYNLVFWGNVYAFNSLKKCNDWIDSTLIAAGSSFSKIDELNLHWD